MSDEFYFNVETGEVERGKESSWSSRLGPYPTREAAEHALATARERNAAWDEEDRREAQD
ncbi:SPOR domain-containing protein [Cellulomonas sp. RIT-PI-Y]|uniref:SPOR domain-containing protein n=1 Tax=Cellulomonas sp. RIT-PI-Y TaxID=3035297 RepID=UPI0021D9CFC3|nr:SPOR domain-containing protein [Cellulomonas sp. RIT-PI-Y]